MAEPEPFDIVSLESKRLSLYRTKNKFESFCEIRSHEDFQKLRTEAKSRDLDVFFLGNGSNTFFSKCKIKTLVAKNRLPKKIEHLEGDLFFVSSSVLVSELLKYCYDAGRDSFFYLASVPAEVGGALAMNAGQGRAVANQSVMDFVEEVHYLSADGMQTAKPCDLGVGYRTTMFTGKSEYLIAGAVFRFPSRNFEGINPIKERIAWAKEHQELAVPNCGTVFKACDRRIIYRLRGLSIRGAMFSKKTDNWISNRSENPQGLLWLLRLTRWLHSLMFKRCETEIIIVE